MRKSGNEREALHDLRVNFEDIQGTLESLERFRAERPRRTARFTVQDRYRNAHSELPALADIILYRPNLKNLFILEKNPNAPEVFISDVLGMTK